MASVGSNIMCKGMQEMYDIDVATSKLPLLLNDFFRHLHSSRKPKVFLCGKELADRRFDLREQVKRLLQSRMGCSPFLGEDISEFQQAPRPDTDHLSIEVKFAEQSDLIIMFLGSPGTLAEVTAFAMNRNTNRKVVVFNDIKFKDEKTFINLGPLKLLPKGSQVFYDTSLGLTPEVVMHLDRIVAKTWFDMHSLEHVLSPTLAFAEFIVLAIIYASYPVRYTELNQLCPFPEQTVLDALKVLFARSLLREEEKKYLPRGKLDTRRIKGNVVTDIANVRAKLMNKRLCREEVVTDYRLII